MNVAEAKGVAREWVADNVAGWPGFRAAHLVGGITAMDDDAFFPPTKDIDMHLIFENDSALVQARGPIPNILEAQVAGLAIEAGLKPVSEYESPAAILGNPELAFHFTVESSLYDPDGWLSGLSREVIPQYADREWVDARMQHELVGQQRAFGLRPLAQELLGPSGELSMLGYSSTFLAGSVFGGGPARAEDRRPGIRHDSGLSGGARPARSARAPAGDFRARPHAGARGAGATGGDRAVLRSGAAAQAAAASLRSQAAPAPAALSRRFLPAHDRRGVPPGIGGVDDSVPACGHRYSRDRWNGDGAGLGDATPGTLPGGAPVRLARKCAMPGFAEMEQLSQEIFALCSTMIERNSAIRQLELVS